LLVGFIGEQRAALVIKQGHLDTAFWLACEDVGNKHIGHVVGVLHGHAKVAQEYRFVDLSFFSQVAEHIRFDGGMYVFGGEVEPNQEQAIVILRKQAAQVEFIEQPFIGLATQLYGLVLHDDTNVAFVVFAEGLAAVVCTAQLFGLQEGPEFARKDFFDL